MAKRKPAASDSTRTEKFDPGGGQRLRNRGVVPGANPDPVEKASADISAAIKRKVGGAVRGSVAVAKKVVYPQVRKATAAEDAESKHKGEMAYYNAKIARNTPKQKKK